MNHAYIFLLEKAHEFDVAMARAQTRRKNVCERLQSFAFNMTDRQFVKRYRLSKDLTRGVIE